MKTGRYGSALALAALVQNPEIVYYLASHSQVNLPHLGGEHGSALAAAFDPQYTSHGINMDVVRFFMESGADINMKHHHTSKYGSPFVAAAFLVKDDLDLIQYLVIDRGADIHTHHTTGDYGSALVAAAHGVNLEVTKYLVNSATDPNFEFQAGAFGNFLVAAAASRHESSAVVKYLVDEGVDVNLELRKGVYRSPLFAAAARGHLEKVRYLVEEGKANLNLRPKTGFGNALSAAIVGPCEFPIDIDVITYFTAPNSEISLALQDGSHDGMRVTLYAIFAPLRIFHSASRVVEYLVDAGADVNLELQVRAYGSVLAAATAIGDLDKVKVLTEKGRSDINAQLTSGFFGSALTVAILADSKIRKLSRADITCLEKIVTGEFHRTHDLLKMPIWGAEAHSEFSL